MVDILGGAMPPRSRIRAVLLAIGALAVVIAGAIIGQLVFAPLIGRTLSDLPATATGASIRQLVYLIAGFGPVYLLLALAVWVREKRSFGYLFRAPRAGAPLALLAGAVLGITLSAAPIMLGVLTGEAVLATASNTHSLVLALLIGLVALFIQSFAEELVFRGWLLPAIRSSMGSTLALVISSIAFAAAHSLNADITATQVISLFLAGVTLGLLTLATKNIWSAGVAHALWNWTQSQGVALDGQLPKAGAIFVANHPTGGPAFGGQELESTIQFFVCALLLVIVVGAITHRHWQRENSETQ